MRLRSLLIIALALLAVACGSDEGREVQGTITIDKVGFLLTPGEVEDYGRDDLEIEADVLGFMDRAHENGANIKGIEEWVGIDFAQSVDGSRLNFALMDMTDAAGAHGRFDALVEEFILVESVQGIGERFAGLAPNAAGVHTIVMFLVGDKIIVITTTTSLTDRQPLLASEQLVEVARLVAPRIIP